jgi:tetratricopeptide (TPR) repeat protein
MQEGRLADAEKMLIAAIQQIEQDEPKSAQLSLYLKGLANLLMRKENYTEAVTHTQRALEIDRQVFGPDSSRVAGDLSNLAMIYDVQGKKEEADQFHKQALEVTRRNLKPDAQSTLLILNNFAAFYTRARRWAEAEPLILEGMKLCESLPQPPTTPCSSFRHWLEEVYRGQGRPEEVDTLVSEAAIRANGTGENAKEVLDGLNTLAQKYEREKNYSQAEATYIRAIAWIEKNEKADAPVFLPMELFRLGQVLEKQGQKTEPEKLYLRAIGVGLNAASPKRPDLASTFVATGLLNLYRSQGRLREMEPIYSRILEIQERLLGPRHANVAFTLLNLADVFQEQEKFWQARPLYERALAIQEENAGPDHPQIISALSRYASLLRKTKQDEQAALLEARVEAIRKKSQR